jgi:hypothetical protein
MHIRIERREYTAHSTIGHLYIDGEFQCYTLEPQWRLDEVKPRAIPPGTYSLTLRYSPKHHASVPHVENVPGFQEIELHPGNYPKDTLGCTLIGKLYSATTPDFIGESQIGFHELMEKLNPVWDAKGTIDITYVNSPKASV